MTNCGLGALPQYCSGVLLAGLARPCSGGCFTVLAWELVLCVGLWAGVLLSYRSQPPLLSMWPCVALAAKPCIMCTE